MADKKNKHILNFSLRIGTILIIAVILVFLFPKIGNFQYEYQKGMPWRYETLRAPFSFPIYKTSEELQEERSLITEKQVPIFNRNRQMERVQIEKFRALLQKLNFEEINQSLETILSDFKHIYQAGIVQLPEDLESQKIEQIKIVSDNVAQTVDFSTVYTLKNAYTSLTNTIDKVQLPYVVREKLKNIDLSHYLQANLDYDLSKTTLNQREALKNIPLTQGMVQQEEIIINKRELVTAEHIKLLDSLREKYQQDLGTTDAYMRTIGGQFLLVIIVLLIFSLYFQQAAKRIFFNNREFIFLYSLFLATVALGSLGFHHSINMYGVPVLFFIIIVNILIGNRPAMYLLICSTLLVSYYAPNSYMFAVMQISAGIVAIFSMKHLQRRSQLMLSIFWIFVTYALVYIAFTLTQNGEIRITNLFVLTWLLINCLLLTLTYPVIYLFEKVFGYTSEITLIELSNPNHPALRKLTQKAPGTFQHSLMVANLAEEAIYRIGGNPLLVRTGALYHDIGKIFDPIYFIENQAGGINPHSQCDFDESAQHIINHVTKGVELAKKYNLPEPIINFIRTHHGKSKVKYFYNSFRNKYPDRKVNEALFTYAGPDPVSREAAVLMMADAVEAASRSLPEKTEDNIINLVNNIVNSQMEDGRFNNADITFKEIETVKKVFVEMLTNIYHSRIAYPKLNTPK